MIFTMNVCSEDVCMISTGKAFHRFYELIVHRLLAHHNSIMKNQDHVEIKKYKINERNENKIEISNLFCPEFSFGPSMITLS